jgi:hypothetical protein
MAYYNPYYEYSKTGGDFVKESGANLGTPRMPSSNEIVPAGSTTGAAGGGRDWSGAIVQGLGATTAALSEQSANPNDFSVDPWAGYKGSAQGLASGGVIGAIIGGVTSQIGTFSKVNKNLNKLDTNVNATDIDPITGRPVYRSQAAINANSTYNDLEKGKKAIDRSFDPMTQTAGWFTGTRKKIKRKQRELNQGLMAANQNYNDKAVLANQQQMAQDQYSQLMNNQSRMQNLYSIGTSLY